jgi:hypothetical protein
VTDTTTDVEKAAPAPLDTVDSTINVFQRRSFNDLTALPIDATEGRALVKDKADLEGVEHIITGVVLRTGASDAGYVSVEATTANDADIVYNDSSTGILAQLSEYLTFKGYVTGWTRENKMTWEDWTINDRRRVTVTVSKKGEKTMHVQGIALHVRGGLRVSKDYDVEIVENGKKRTIKATTYYLS